MDYKFITFEGCEGSGKSTQAKLLKHHLEERDYKVIITREPGGTPLAEDLRKILLSGEKVKDALTEFLLLSTARRDHIIQKIKPHLEEGYIVICDRFYDSSIAYQGYAQGLDIDVMKQIINLTTESVKPDVTFLIDIDPKISIERINKHRADEQNHYDKMDTEFHTTIRTSFLEIAKAEQDRVKVIDGDKTQDNISKEIMSKLGLA